MNAFTRILLSILFFTLSLFLAVYLLYGDSTRFLDSNASYIFLDDATTALADRLEGSFRVINNAFTNTNIIPTFPGGAGQTYEYGIQ